MIYFFNSNDEREYCSLFNNHGSCIISLTLNDISVNVDGENATSITKSFKTNDPEKLTETRDGKTVQYGVKYT